MTYEELCARVQWAWADSWYEACDVCREVELVLKLNDGRLWCESCFDREGSDLL